jgi:hypothetical protein
MPYRTAIGACTVGTVALSSRCAAATARDLGANEADQQRARLVADAALANPDWWGIDISGVSADMSRCWRASFPTTSSDN